MTNTEKIKNDLTRYLKRKGLNVNEDCEDSYRLEIIYTKHYTTHKIYLRIYYDEISYSTDAYLYTVYVTRRNNKRRSTENINKLKTKHNRKDYKNAVYKNVLRIIGWLDKIAEKEKEEQDRKTNYASELEFYFKDKYGNVDLNVNDWGGEIHISATVRYGKDNHISETHNIIYKDGNYFLEGINRHHSNYKRSTTVYKQRKKNVEKIKE